MLPSRFTVMGRKSILICSSFCELGCLLLQLKVFLADAPTMTHMARGARPQFVCQTQLRFPVKNPRSPGGRVRGRARTACTKAQSLCSALPFQLHLYPICTIIYSIFSLNQLTFTCTYIYTYLKGNLNSHQNATSSATKVTQ